ncbi:3'-5' exonuclease (plasmid) [Nocardia sp. NBC_01377]
MEIAILPVSGTTVDVDEMRTWMVRPQRLITPTVTRKVHGITNADVADCPPWAGVAEQVQNALGDRILVAHNANLERRVLSEHLPEWTPPLVLDTLRFAKAVWPGRTGYGLGNLVAHAGLDVTAVSDHGHHRAGWDTWAAWRLLVRLVDDSGLDWEQILHSAAPTECMPPTAPEGGLW